MHLLPKGSFTSRIKDSGMEEINDLTSASFSSVIWPSVLRNELAEDEEGSETFPFL